MFLGLDRLDVPQCAREDDLRIWTGPVVTTSARSFRRIWGIVRDDITVLLPARNAQSTVGRAIRSVLRSMPDPTKILVLDDASEDGTADVVQGLCRQDRRIGLIATQTPSGVAGALNILLEAATTPLVARMDADDIGLPWRFAAQLRELRRQSVDLVFTPSIMFGPSRVAVRPQPPVGAGPAAVPYELLVANTLMHPTLLGTRSAIVGVGGYRAVPAEDWDLFMRLALSGARLSRISLPGLLYRRHSGQVTQDAAWQARSVDTETAATHDALVQYLFGFGEGSFAAMSGRTADTNQLAAALHVMDAVWQKSSSFSFRDRIGVRANVIGARRYMRVRYSSDQLDRADRARGA